MKLNFIHCFILILLSFFIATCSESGGDQRNKTKCEKIKDILTDCMGIHRGALNYVDSCGDISYEKVKSAATCEEVFKIIEN